MRVLLIEDKDNKLSISFVFNGVLSSLYTTGFIDHSKLLFSEIGNTNRFEFTSVFLRFPPYRRAPLPDYEHPIFRKYVRDVF